MSTLPTSDRVYDDDDDSPVDEIDELLVAYLDGELDERERRDLEDRLVQNESLRRRLGELQSGWELLDQLPRTAVTGDFAQTTVEMIAATQSRAVSLATQQYRWQRLAWFAAIISTVAVVSSVGWFFPRVVDEFRFRKQLADLPLAEHIDAYLMDVDLDTMVELSQQERWRAAMQLASDSGGIVVPVSLELNQRDKQQTIQLLGRLERKTQAALATNWDRLNSLSEDRLKAVRERYEAVRRLDHPSDVLKTMQQYASWWNQLSPESKNRIFMAKDEERTATILEMVERSSLLWVQNYANALGETDRTLIYERLLLIATDRIRESNAFVEEQLAAGNQWPGDPRWRNIKPDEVLGGISWAIFFMIDQQVRRGGSEGANGGSGGGPNGGRGFAGGGPPPPPPPGEGRSGVPSETRANLQTRWRQILFSPPNADELAAVEEVMSSKALAILGARENSETTRQDILRRWCAETIAQAAPRRDSAEVILDRYESLEESYRDSLDLKLPDNIYQELQDRRFRP